MKRCYIVGAAPTALPVLPADGDFVIAADGGYQTLTRHGIVPDLLLGDFDSLPAVPKGVPIQRYPVEKDDTDSALAAQLGLERGCDTFLLDGCLGGQLDHTLANLALLVRLTEQGMTVYALDGDWAVTALHNGQMSFPAEAKGQVSLFSHGDAAYGVTLRGLYYPLENATLTRQVALGVSNQFTGTAATVHVGQGTLLIYTARKNYSFFLDQCRKT